MGATGFFFNYLKPWKNLTSSPLNFKPNVPWCQQLDQFVV